MLRGCTALLVLLSASLASAQDAPEGDLGETLTRARELDGRAEHRAASLLYEAYAIRCLTHRTAVLEPCGEVASALGRAFELSRALGDAPAADRIGSAYVGHLLYAEPREAMRIGYELARMHLDAERFDAAEATLDRWVELSPHAAPAEAIVMDALRARVALAAGQRVRATRHWRQLERRFERSRDELDDGAVPRELVIDAVAEARLLRAESDVERFLATGAPPPRRGLDDHAWFARVFTPWRVRAERRLLLARMQLERVYELGSPHHSVAAAARIGELYNHLSDLHARMTPPSDEWMRVLLTRGDDRPGYDEALAHFETCVRWAEHHEVARGWATLCEQRLNALDPERYPLAAELSGTAVYLPVSVALPPTPR